MLRFALHRQGQNSQVSTRCPRHALPRFTQLLVSQPCTYDRAWLSSDRKQRKPFHRQPKGFRPGPQRPGFHPRRNPMRQPPRRCA